MSIHKVSGSIGDLEVFEDKLTITPKGLGGIVESGGLRGPKTIPFASITAIKHRRAGGFLPGYIQFELPGGLQEENTILGGNVRQNIFFFKSNGNEKIEEIKAFIERKISEIKNHNTTIASSSPTDELIKLARLKEQGLLSEEEFSKAKQKILGIS